MLGRYRRRRAFRLNQQCFQWHTVPVLRQQRIGIDFHTDGICGESFAMHKVVGLICIGAAVNLKLHSVPVRVLVIDGQRQTVMYTPVRRNTELLEPVVSLEELPEIRIGVTDMIDACTGRRIDLNRIGSND